MQQILGGDDCILVSGGLDPTHNSLRGEPSLRIGLFSDPLLTNLLVSVPSILTSRYILFAKLRSLPETFSRISRVTIPLVKVTTPATNF